MPVEKRTFRSRDGHMLAARFDRPEGPVRGNALFAHCFTCTKDIVAARRIAANLARLGVAVLRFDFTGLGASEGDFADSNFTSNVTDLLADLDADALDAEAGQSAAGDGEEGGETLADMVEQPAKVMRIGTMIKQLLEEVRAAPLDEASRARLKDIHRTSIKELEDGLSPDLQAELERLALRFGITGEMIDDEIASPRVVGDVEAVASHVAVRLYRCEARARPAARPSR